MLQSWPYAFCTSGFSGPSENLSQQSPNEWVWTSGSKHVCCEHHANTLHGRRENGPAASNSIDTSGQCYSNRQSVYTENTDALCRKPPARTEQHWCRSMHCQNTVSIHLLAEGWGSMTDTPLRSLLQSVWYGQCPILQPARHNQHSAQEQPERAPWKPHCSAIHATKCL